MPLPIGRSEATAKAMLGRDLFYDRRLSRSMTLSCQSCHDLSTNGASSVAADRSDAGRRLAYNTPTVFNTAYSFRLGWEGKTRSLRDFAMGTLGTDHLMGGNGLAARRLAADPRMTSRFRAVYGGVPSEDRIADALSVFMATLVTPDAPFDRWLRGDRTALTKQQVRGYDRFQQLGCASCHQGINVGANIFQRRGIFHPLGDPNPRYLRVPSLRNVATTAPYFHDGSVGTLPDAIRRMARAQLDLTIGDRDLADVTAFLGSLTGTYQGHTVRAAPDWKK
ncbi:c-type cytochrome [Sphingobium sp. PNB]|nr:c-type cytochrome [Sphingobium sp. PNB]